MANADKNILITPNIGSATAAPTIAFTGNSNSTITMTMTDDGVLSWTGNVGQLFSITNNLTGTLFSVNNISGLPILEITDAPALVTYGPITGQAGATVLTDVSGACDGIKSFFTLAIDATPLANTYIVDSKDLTVTVNGQQLTPYVSMPPANPYITADCDFGTSTTFRVRQNSNQVIIYNTPDVGSQVSLIARKTSSTQTVRRYPIPPQTIALGD